MTGDVLCGGLLDVPPSAAWAQANDGCGEGLALRDSYRCLDCGRWYHAGCLARHFGRTPVGDGDGVTSWLYRLAWGLVGAGCLTRGCIVGFGYEREDDGELLLCVDHYEPGRQVMYRRYPAGRLVTEPAALGEEIRKRLALDHVG